MSAKRPERTAKRSYAADADGHMLKAIRAAAGGGVELRPTATIADYDKAHPKACEFNEECIANGDIGLKLKEGEGWREELGVCEIELPKNLGFAAAADELNTRFKDGKLDLAGSKQIKEQNYIKGGWAKGYYNVLDPRVKEQEKCIVAVPPKSFATFKGSLPFTHDVIKEVQVAIEKKVPEYKGKIDPTEYTFFFGTSKASCTLWHSDFAEHIKKAPLVLTSLTLLTDGTTSMCVATKEETYLKKPGQTILFDPKLFHRSGCTEPQIIKLSIHWKLRSEPKVKSEAGGSGTSAASEEEGKATEEAAATTEAKEEKATTKAEEQEEATVGVPAASFKKDTEPVAAAALATAEPASIKPSVALQGLSKGGKARKDP